MQRSILQLSALLSRLTHGLNIIAGICLFSVMAVVSVGVVMRYAFQAPLLGVNEIVQLAAVALVMASLPYCTDKDNHVAVDVFEKPLGPWGRMLGDIVSRVLSGFVLGLLCQRAVLKALDALEWGDATNMLGMPIWPFYVIIAMGAGLCVLIFAAQLLLILTRGPK